MRLVAAAHLVARDVDGEVADAQRLVDRLGRRAQAGADAGDELLRVERLDDVVVGARLEALARRRRCRSCAVSMMIGTPDSARMRLQTSMPSMPGQHEVEQHEVGLRRAERVDAPRRRRRRTTGSKPSVRSTMPIISARAVSSSTTRMRDVIRSFLSVATEIRAECSGSTLSRSTPTRGRMSRGVASRDAAVEPCRAEAAPAAVGRM